LSVGAWKEVRLCSQQLGRLKYHAKGGYRSKTDVVRTVLLEVM